MKPKALLIPFSYPDYPEETINKFIELSKNMLKRIGIDFAETNNVINHDDIAKAVKQAKSEDFDFIIVNLISWVDASNVIGVLDNFRNEKMCLWSHTTYKKNDEILTLGCIPGACVVREVMEEAGYSFKFVYGMPDSKEVEKEIKDFAYASYAIARMRNIRVGLLGYLAIGIYTGGFEHIKVKNLLGPEIVHIDQWLLIKYTEAISGKEIKELLNRVKNDWAIMENVDNESLEKTLKMYVALKRLKDEYKLDAMTIKCQFELSRIYKVVPCIPLSIIGEIIPASCEGDIPLVLSQLILSYISGNKVTSYGDVLDIYGNGILLGACGFATFSNLVDKKPKISKHNELYCGLLVSSPYKEGMVTVNRIASNKNSYKMHIVTGNSVKNTLSFHEVGSIADEVIPTYPLMQLNFEGDMKRFMQDVMSQHYAIVYGNYRDRLIDYCKLMGIKPMEI